MDKNKAMANFMKKLKKEQAPEKQKKVPKIAAPQEFRTALSEQIIEEMSEESEEKAKKMKFDCNELSVVHNFSAFFFDVPETIDVPDFTDFSLTRCDIDYSVHLKKVKNKQTMSKTRELKLIEPDNLSKEFEKAEVSTVKLCLTKKTKSSKFTNLIKTFKRNELGDVPFFENYLGDLLAKHNLGSTEIS